MNAAKLKAGLTQAHETIERRLSYLGEAEARLIALKARINGARHFIRRREREHAQDELMHVINEARRLHLHLEAWNNYV